MDKLISSFAKYTNSDNPAPKLGRCETLVWAGGYRLDKDGAKAIFENLEVNSPRSYSLKVDHFGSTIQKITPVKKGTLVSAWTSWLVPQDAKYEDVVLQWVLDGQVRSTQDVALSSSWRSRTYKSNTLSKKG